MSLHKSEVTKKRREIEERKDKIKFLHLQSLSESQIADQLGCDQSTVSRALKELREEASTEFIYRLAKSDLAYFYKNEIDTIDLIKKECFSIYNKTNDSTIQTDKIKLAALKLIADACESRFRMLTEGPGIMALRALEERLANIEQSFSPPSSEEN